jgi:hypothetical protein
MFPVVIVTFPVVLVTFPVVLAMFPVVLVMFPVVLVMFPVVLVMFPVVLATTPFTDNTEFRIQDSCAIQAYTSGDDSHTHACMCTHMHTGRFGFIRI